jgi:hypothetical protein
MLISFSKCLPHSDAQHLQRLGPDGMETLLDRHLAIIRYMASCKNLCSLVSPSSRSYYYLAVVTLLDQLNPNEFDWQQVSVILRRPHSLPAKFLFGMRN